MLGFQCLQDPPARISGNKKIMFLILLDCTYSNIFIPVKDRAPNISTDMLSNLSTVISQQDS